MVDVSKVVVTGATLYGIHTHSDFRRQLLALNSIKYLVHGGYQVVIVDGGSIKSFLNSAWTLGAKVFRQGESGFGNGKREAVARAFETEKEIIALIDLEKFSYARTLDVTIEEIGKGADLVIPRRVSLESYSEFQRDIEMAGNAYWKLLTERDLDVWFGQRTFKRELAVFFLDYGGDNWDAIFVPLIDIICHGYDTRSVDVDYTHDPWQVNAEHKDWQFYDKRVQQLNCLTEPLRKRWEKYRR
ncbi:hypothetical protein J4467_01940 [Candidatus Woesearchaeota archaeon]|nr:hypothetical protein [Candidatus Woesearchaeota archaeon]